MESLMNVWPLPRILFKPLSNIQETRPTALIAAASDWERVRSSLNLPLVVQAEPTGVETTYVETLTNSLPSLAEVVYAVGEGAACDVARQVACMNQKPLVIVPTALSSDSPFVATAMIRDGDGWVQMQTGPANEVILDMDVLTAAAPHARAAAVADIFSILTAVMDWSYAAQKQQVSETPLVPWVMSFAAQITGQASKIVTALGAGEPDALRTLVDLLVLTVQLDNLLGHHRLTQGTEHIFANAVQLNATVVEVSHAERVGPGLLLATALYNKDCTTLRGMLEAAGVRLTQIKAADLRESFLALPDYARAHNAPFTILNELSAASEPLELALMKSSLFQ
jgi:glycerol dehydrogenase-like iron-containing ADH family enzyme